MNKIFASIIFLLNLPLLFAGESLWDPGFKGYLSDVKRVSEGDLVFIKIDTDSSLSFTSANKDAKSVTFEFSGGEYSNLFSFLPVTKAGADSSFKSDEKYGLQTDIAARINFIEDSGHAYIEGTKSVSIDSKNERISISGYIDTRDLALNNIIPFSKVANSKLVFTSFVYPEDQVLKEEDITWFFKNIESETSTLPEEELETSPSEPEGDIYIEDRTEEEIDTTEEEKIETTESRISLTDEKKKELLLRYINRLIDLLFK